MRLALFLLLILPAIAKGVNGTPQDVQAAIDSARDGDVIQIASGTFNWSSGINISKRVELKGNQTRIVNSGIDHIVTVTAKGVIIDGISFDAAGFGHGVIRWQVNGGLIYDCTFTSTDKSDNSAIQFKNDQSASAWSEPDYLGSADTNGDRNTYVEDCTFKYQFLQAIDFDDNSRTVVRYCTFDNSAIASHGQETSPVGSRQQEIYNCTFVFTVGSSTPNPFPLNMNRFIFVRGGGPWLIHNNVIPDISSQYWGNKGEVDINLYNIRRASGYVPCQKSYPAARQMTPIYLWNNTGSGNYNSPALSDYQPDECGNNQHTADYVKQGRDLFLNTAKPGYTPYTYPHPLRGGNGPKPTPTPTPQPTSTPTPTPQPTATPTPSPSGSSFSQWLDSLGQWVHDHPAVPNK